MVESRANLCLNYRWHDQANFGLGRALCIKEARKGSTAKPFSSMVVPDLGGIKRKEVYELKT